jgi:deoxyxylulose-5-phosphate synthase
VGTLLGKRLKQERGCQYLIANGHEVIPVGTFATFNCLCLSKMYEGTGPDRFTDCGTADARACTSSSGGGIHCFRPPASLESGE